MQGWVREVGLGTISLRFLPLMANSKLRTLMPVKKPELQKEEALGL